VSRPVVGKLYLYLFTPFRNTCTLVRGEFNVMISMYDNLDFRNLIYDNLELY
jgi:hypothetical protein